MLYISVLFTNVEQRKKKRKKVIFILFSCQRTWKKFGRTQPFSAEEKELNKIK